eukprot:3699128-Amphidinium_carterae.1
MVKLSCATSIGGARSFATGSELAAPQASASHVNPLLEFNYWRVAIPLNYSAFHLTGTLGLAQVPQPAQWKEDWKRLRVASSMRSWNSAR